MFIRLLPPSPSTCHVVYGWPRMTCILHKYGRSLTWFMLGTWWKRHVWIEIKVHWKLPLFYAGVRTCWRLQYPFAWGQSKEWVPFRKSWGSKTYFSSLSSGFFLHTFYSEFRIEVCSFYLKHLWAFGFVISRFLLQYL